MAMETQRNPNIPSSPLLLPRSPHQSCGRSSKDTPWRGVPTTPSGWEGPCRAENGPGPPPSTLLYLSFVTKALLSAPSCVTRMRWGACD